MDHEPNIAWYPSAGSDFRALLYMSPEYAKINPAKKREERFPDIFLYTDYYPWPGSGFLDSSTIYKDARTLVKLDKMEELPGLNLPIDNEIAVFPEGSKVTGRTLYLEVSIRSDILGEFTYPVVYAFVENEPFCSRVLLSGKNRISHIIHVRYGGGCGGGGRSSGVWVRNVLKRLGCEVFVTDRHYDMQSGDEEACRLYPNLRGRRPAMEIVRSIKSKSWSGHGDVAWNVLV
jgi:hypothetical protein